MSEGCEGFVGGDFRRGGEEDGGVGFDDGEDFGQDHVVCFGFADLGDDGAGLEGGDFGGGPEHGGVEG